MKNKEQQAGLTLIEVLIALAIIGVAMTAVIKATSQNIHSTGYLQAKTEALWIGQEVINEIRGGVLKIGSSSGTQKLTKEVLGQEWLFQTQEEETSNSRIKKIVVKVFADEKAEAEESSTITLESYIYHEA